MLLQVFRNYNQTFSLYFFLDITTAVTSTIKVGGYRSLWLGLGPSLMRDVPFSSNFVLLLTFAIKINFSKLSCLFETTRSGILNLLWRLKY